MPGGAGDRQYGTFTFQATDQYGGTSNVATITVPVTYATSCKTLLTAANANSFTAGNGSYTIQPSTGVGPVPVWCDMTDQDSTGNKGWTLIVSYNPAMTPDVPASFIQQVAAGTAVTQGSHTYMAPSVVEALALVSSTVRIQQRNGTAWDTTHWVESTSGIAIGRLQGGYMLNNPTDGSEAGDWGYGSGVTVGALTWYNWDSG